MSEPQFEVSLARSIMVPMRDGVRLATDIYRPADGVEPLPGPFPTLLIRTPYNKGSAETIRRKGVYFASRGYAVVIQDVRGRYESEGEFYFLAQEAEDGYDTIVWVGQQPWCDGKVGTLGTSYLAWTQSALAALNPPHLAAMYVNEGGANAYTSTVRQNGAFELRFLAWAFMGAATSPSVPQAIRDALVESAPFSRWVRQLPLKPGVSPLALAPDYERWALDIMYRGEYDEYWKQPGFNFEEHAQAHADVPILFSGAWYDSYTRATTENFVRFGEIKRGPVRLLMGPWTHGGYPPDLTWSGDVEFGPTASIGGSGIAADVDDHHLRFFDHWLKGIDNEIGSEPPVRIFVMGGGDGHRTPEGRLYHGGHWRAEQEWPLARTQWTNYYLGGGGRLGTGEPAAAEDGTTFAFDPRDPVPTVGGNISSLSDFAPVPQEIAARVPPPERWASIVSVGPQDQRTLPATFGASPPALPLAARPDVLVFQSEPLAAPLEVTGPLTAVLWVDSTAPDTDITVKLIDRYPPSADYPEGYAMNISDTILRLRYRHGGQAEPLTPGVVEKIEIPMYPTSNVFGAGHRIRLDISSSNFPRFDVNPNTGEPLGQETHTEVALNTIHHDRAHPSHLVLPVIPVGKAG
ncbi:MAG TPA: CocE/NonD family hydrolase [Thermomicrobiaceae bacterium]|nr:CocE/NonD family hydrolase [Thermomicrobiaceae bacterium]